MSQSTHLSHINSNNEPGMVSVSEKANSYRVANAKGWIKLPQSLCENAIDGSYQNKKGPVIQTAIIAGTQAVKRCSDMIPFCHPLPVESIQFSHHQEGDKIHFNCEVACHYKTGVEMEALSGVSTALLTLYDMLKSAGQDMEIGGISIVEKRGGKSDINSQAAHHPEQNT